jgi:hypothetical protein
MFKIIKLGNKISHDFHKHKCSYCNTKYTYDYQEDTELNGIFDDRLTIKCPNCNKYDFCYWDSKCSSKYVVKHNLLAKNKRGEK